jgi:chlorophyllide a oxygenase
VEQNLQRVADLKAEAAALERLQESTGPVTSSAQAASSSGRSSSRGLVSSSAVASSATAAAATVSTSSSSSRTSRGSSGSSVATAPAPSRASSSSSSGGSSARRPRGSSLRPDRGLRSSLVAEQPLKEFWYPAEFSSQLDSNTLVPFELFDEPWVLFR